MDYEQKYNAALKIAEEVYHDHRNDNDRDWRDLLTELFPELKEPKEEQIRKKLIKAFGSMVKEQWGGIAIEDILAWLEKQGEKQSIWTESDRTMAFTLLRDVDQMAHISNEGKNERLQWLNSLEDKFNNKE